MSLPVDAPTGDALGVLSHFRVEFYDCLYKRGDALFELTDALLYADGQVKTPVELCLAAEHRRGHGAMYAALDAGWLEPTRLRRERVSGERVFHDHSPSTPQRLPGTRQGPAGFLRQGPDLLLYRRGDGI